MIARFLIVQPVPPRIYEDRDLLYDLIRTIWERELYQQGGLPLTGPLFCKRLEFIDPAFDTFHPYIPVMIHGPAGNQAQ